ncbi:MAG: AgmX/PglI C-terminal domain-containing protein [Myxococcota bacterium]|nr:AgmX/PglI C-terminal domain-containing protein [Myxococcota bacterium]
MVETSPKSRGLASGSKATAKKAIKGRPRQASRPSQSPARRPLAAVSENVPKVLRIGIIQSGKIVEERIIRNRDTVSIGQSEKNTFVIVSSDLPSRFDIFEIKSSGDYTLHFTDPMTGRVAVQGEVKELTELRTSGIAKKKGKTYQLELNEQSRGKIIVGDSTILFQFVAPPPIQPRPQLPAAARGGPFKNIEWFITTCYIVSFVLHAAFFTYLEVNDWPVRSKWEMYLDYQEMIAARDATFEKKKEIKVEDGEGEATEEEESKEQEAKEEKKPAKAKAEENTGPKKSAEEIARERAERRAALAEQLAQRGINKILGSLGSGSADGAIVDVLRGGDVGADQDELLAQVSGVGVATGENGALRGPAGGKGSGEAADISQLKMKGGDVEVATAGAGQERKVRGNVKRRNPSAVDGTGVLSPQEVAKVVNRRLGSIKGCYERALRRDPTLGGKVTVRFTISGSGKVSAARTTLNELTPEVGNCIVSAFKRFRFPQPDGGALTVEYPFMFTPAN